MNWSTWQIVENEDKKPRAFGEETWSRRRALVNACLGVLVTLIIGLAVGCGGGGGSASSPPPQSNPVPSITSLSPSSAVAGAAAQTLTINGSDFISSSSVTYNGKAHTATFVSSAQLTITLGAADQAVAGSYPVVVTNPAPGGGSSSAVNFTVNNPAPTISTLSPSSALVGAPSQALTINGTNYLSNSTVTYSGTTRAATLVNSTELQITLSAGDQAVAGSYPVVVTNPAPGGGASNAVSFSVNPPVPTVSLSLSPASITLGNSATLTWSSTNATACSASGAWSGSMDTSGTQTVTPMAASLSIPGILTYTLTCQNSSGATVTGNAALTVTYPTPSGRLAQVRSFEYVIAEITTDPAIDSDIANSRADLVILGACLNEPALNRTAADPTGTKLIFSYVDVAEASSCLEPSLFTSSPLPSWFGNPNPGYPGLYTVQYWNAAWEPYIFAVIDQAVSNGFDGIFLDVLTADQEWSKGNIEANPVYTNATTAMVTLLSDIRNYVTTTYPGKTFYLIGNNPQDIVMVNVASLANLDAIFNEVLYYIQSPTNGTVSSYMGTGWANYLNQTIAPLYAASGLPVFGNDYPTPLSNTSADSMSFTFYSSLGWIPSVTTPLQTDGIFSTGPFMLMATPSNSTVTGYPDFVNFLSGGTATNATLIGGNEGDYFLGGPGQNIITGGSGDDTVYAHPANAAEKGELILDLSSSINGQATTPSVSVEINGKEVIQPTQITAAYGTSTQRLEASVAGISTISSVQIVVTDTSYTNNNDYSNLAINDIIYNGVKINLSLGQYPNGGGPPYAYSNNGTVTFPGSAFAVVSPFPSNTSDVIDGGGGANTVVYRGPYSNYTISQQSDGSWLVTSASTAEGPDKLTNIQTLVFSDQQIELP